MSIRIEGLEDVQRRLKALGNARRAAQANKKASIAALDPALRMTRFLAPKKDGILAESFGVVSRKVGADQVFHIQPRRSFRGKGTAVGDSDKSKAAHKKAGFKVHKGVPPSFYAIIVATGRIPLGDPSSRFTDPQLGRKIRAKNPFLENVYERTHSKVPQHYINYFKQHLTDSLN